MATRPIEESRMELVIVGVALALPARLLFGVVTGRVRLSSCCGAADPRRDLRMRDAFADADADAEVTDRTP
jgi:hypothetical protein